MTVAAPMLPSCCFSEFDEREGKEVGKGVRSVFGGVFGGDF